MRKPTTIHLEEYLIKDIRKLAVDQNKSMSDIIEECMIEYINNIDK